jgi:hypothetical protein
VLARRRAHALGHGPGSSPGPPFLREAASGTQVLDLKRQASRRRREAKMEFVPWRTF